jgi:periplasmic protein TonB
MLIARSARLRWIAAARFRMRLAAVLSVGLHAALLAGLLLWFRHVTPVANAPDAQGTVELVMLEQQGSHDPTAPPEATLPEPAPSAVAPTPPTEPPPQAEPELLPVPPPPPPSAPAQAMSSPAKQVQEAPQINLSGNDSETDAMVMASPQVIPASVDAKYHNREPIYPLDAVRHAEQGAVTLVIHVSPAGLTAGVDIAESSGFTSLDRAARDAVWDWRFLPAVENGQPIPFDMKLRVVFHLD